MREDKSPVVFHLTTSFWWPVTVRLPQDGGTVADQQFEARIRLLTDDELHPELPEGMSPREAIQKDRDFLRSAITEIRGVESGIGPDVDLFEEMMQFAPYRLGLMNAVFEAHRGQAARLGN